MAIKSQIYSNKKILKQMDLIIQELHRNFFTEEQIDLLKNKTVERLQAPKPVVEALKKELQNFRFPI
ncbi:MAG TPA: hypothetical protein VKK79_07900 [Candidatus Lokiarchaeia archaeon]|nr:hypothetical protein [Candidatus Lokiarchaeia archaeon]